ncbi:phage major tail protein, TP901-1 family [Bacillus pumilus]|uniref:phage major tail protein, TP901-1 family n=1 Tax=Bacillus pumilus TaxID=1408 RepID=UPI001C222EED|nr:phage major tail protein, TP901-1 family [Bacillus pumilus]MBU8609214.1 phage major tail protein, TP901-1 family [Bacillus pumilus]
MVNLLNGKDEVYFVQTMKSTDTEGSFVAFQTEGSHTKEQDSLDESTKSGRIVGYGTKSETIELSYYAADDDPGQKDIEAAYDNEEAVQVWKVNLNLNKNGKHDSEYGHAIIENLEKSAPQDGFIEVSTTLPVLGKTFKDELDPLDPAFIAKIRSTAGADGFKQFGELNKKVDTP